jgi:hypothetical protein
LRQKWSKKRSQIRIQTGSKPSSRNSTRAFKILMPAWRTRARRSRRMGLRVAAHAACAAQLNSTMHRTCKHVMPARDRWGQGGGANGAAALNCPRPAVAEGEGREERARPAVSRPRANALHTQRRTWCGRCGAAPSYSLLQRLSGILCFEFWPLHHHHHRSP